MSRVLFSVSALRKEISTFSSLLPHAALSFKEKMGAPDEEEKHHEASNAGGTALDHPNSSVRCATGEDKIPVVAGTSALPVAAMLGAISVLEFNCQASIAKLDDFVTLNALEGGRMRLQLKDTRPVLFSHDFAKLFELPARQKNITYGITFSDFFDLSYIKVDPPQLSRAFGNLLSNALKYTSVGGSIQVRSVLCLVL